MNGIDQRSLPVAESSATIIFCVWIAVSPGGLYSVFLGGTLGFAGLVISIIGIAKNSGRVAGVVGIIVFILGWVINTAAVGRL